MKPLTTSVYTFADLLEGGYLYVDKTAEIYKLISESKGQYFLARPRRFGKSLLISTLKAIFLGRRDLFKGLAIDKLDYNWQKYPVIHLDMGSCAAESAEDLEAALVYVVNANATEYGIDLTQKRCGLRLLELVEKLAERDGKVVILVDEYDKPLLNRIGQSNVSEFQRVLKSFYSVIKTTEPYQRFALITGVSKFSKVSIFSDLNNLTDLTMQAEAATLLGYTQEELENNFSEYIDALATVEGSSKEACLDKLRDWYNGYRFHQRAQTVYNPVSVMKCLQDKEFKNYWFETGTPTFLIELFKREQIDLENTSAFESDFSCYEPSQLSILPLLFQTGYLTIKSSSLLGEETRYELGFPNSEVKRSFSKYLAQGLAHIPGAAMTGAAIRIIEALNENRLDDMLETMKVFFANIPYDITIAQEKYYQTIFYTVFNVLGSMIDAEARTNTGRIDAVVKTDTCIYILEFKLNGTAEQALQQIEDKQYALPYADDPRQLFKIGVEFSAEKRNISKWLIKG